jgi:hypothetical protein
VPLLGDVHVVEIREPPNFAPPEEYVPRFKLLNAEFRVLGELIEKEGDGTWQRTRIQDPEQPEFRRGDATGDHTMNVADAVVILQYLFAGGSAPACPDAADATDDGRIDLSDPIRILLYMFLPQEGQWQLPWPGAWRCGKDRTPDDLPACDYEVTGCGMPL